MSWAEEFKARIDLPQRAAFLTQLQTLVADLRNEANIEPGPLMREHPELALAYMDEGPKKERARRVLR